METYNARGLKNRVKRREVFYWLKRKGTKVALLQETHSTLETEKEWEADWDGDIQFCHGTSAARGVAILFDKSISKKIFQIIKDTDGRFIILDIEINIMRLTLANVYGPNEDNSDFYIDFIEKIESIPQDNRIIGGDFNLVLEINIDKKGGLKTTHMKSKCVLQSYMEETEMIDIWRFQNPEEKKYTWIRRNPSLILCRLDFFLVSYGLVQKIEKSFIGTSFRS